MMRHTENDKHTEMEGGERESERERERKCVGSADVYLLLRMREYACDRLCTCVYRREGGERERRRERRGEKREKRERRESEKREREKREKREEREKGRRKGEREEIGKERVRRIKFVS